MFDTVFTVAWCADPARRAVSIIDRSINTNRSISGSMWTYVGVIPSSVASYDLPYAAPGVRTDQLGSTTPRNKCNGEIGLFQASL